MSSKGIDFLESLPRWEKNAFSPLEVPRQILAKLGNPQNTVKAVHVAGTNGKGSTCSFISSALLASGCRVGQFCSPHLSRVTERCLVDGEEVSEASFDRALCKVADAVDWDSRALTYFVATTAASFLIFKEMELDWMVIETGLGGTFDATNLIEKPKLCVITKIALDHRDVLGETISEISRNKAGIIKPGAMVVSYKQYGEVDRAICQRGAIRGVSTATTTVRDHSICFRAEKVEIEVPKTSLLQSDAMRNNALLAFRACLSLELEPHHIEEGFAQTSWPGRMERVRCGERIEFLLDGAHNPDGVSQLLHFVSETFASANTQVYYLIGMRERADWQESVHAFVEEVSHDIESKICLLPWDDEKALLPKDDLEVLIKKCLEDRADPLGKISRKEVPVVRSDKTLAELINKAKKDVRDIEVLPEGFSETFAELLLKEFGCGGGAKSVVVAFGSLHFIAQLRNSIIPQ